MIFICTENSGSTKEGAPYNARFTDEHGNRQSREIYRPGVIAEYFKSAGIIDSHNHARRGELNLESNWVTQNCWFRLVTTLIGMTITDCWKAFKFHTTTEITIKDFADRVSNDLIGNTHSTLQRDAFIPADISVCSPCDSINKEPSVSPLSSNSRSSLSSVASKHEFLETDKTEANGRHIRRTCSYFDCKEKTSLECQNPICLQVTKKRNKHESKGVFYCSKHIVNHHLMVLPNL